MNSGKSKAFRDIDLHNLEWIALISAPYLRNAQKLMEYFEIPLPEESLLSKYRQMGMIGKCGSFVALLRGVETAARCDVRVLLEGQSGTGKELVARSIHKMSSRCDGPFVTVDCGAIPVHLLESELFGHVRGAFTGATYERKGLFQEADHGTLFMDEIANMPTDMQMKLMRVLQEKEIRPVGSNKARKVDVRIISAASVSLQKLMKKNKFREDLFYRLYVFPLSVPSLVERKEDIPTLANHFLTIFAEEQNKKVRSLHPALLNFLSRRPWPGNIRELENFIERLVTMASERDEFIGPGLLPPDLRKEYRKIKAAGESWLVPRSLNEMLTEYEEEIIRKTLDECDWNQSKAARILKVSLQTIRYKIQKLGIVKPLNKTF